MAGEVIPSSTGNYNSSNIAQATYTFTGAAGAGAQGTAQIATVTGLVLVRAMVTACLTTLVGVGATTKLGTTNSTAAFVALTTASTITSTNAIWVSATPTAETIALPAGATNIIVGTASGTTAIIHTIATADITAGALTTVWLWDALIPGSSLVAVNF